METKTKVSTCEHGNGVYSLSIEVNDTHVDLSTWGYAPTVGQSAKIAIYDFTKAQMTELRNQITAAIKKLK